MKFILDTNVLSELTRIKPEKNVMEWFNNCPEDNMYISSITLGEIETGISSLEPGKKQNQLLLWFGSLQNSFKNRILTVDDITAIRWGEIRGSLKRKGTNIPVIDGLIAATAITNNAVLVTGNTKDFNFPGMEVLNPWLE
jgi:hypothetical protein